MITRRVFLGTAATGLLASALTAEAQQGVKIVRVGLLSTGAPGPASAARWKALRDQLREMGYVEGQNVIYESRWGGAQVGQLRALTTELLHAKVDILVTAGSEAALAARQETSSIPIVMATGGDPVEMKLAASLARPGGNVTGVISLIGELTGKRLELLKQFVPRASRVAFLRDPDNRSSALSLRAGESVAKSLGVVLQGVNARNSSELQAAFMAIKRDRADAVILGENTLFLAHRRRIAELAIEHRLPMMVPAKEFALAGALLSYGTDYLDMFRRAALYVDKILKGAKPGDLPVEQPTRFELVINLKTAKALGLTIPQSVLGRADEVIQ
jgi:putative tryptophan/tyrosine transport system substrate-binding protein